MKRTRSWWVGFALLLGGVAPALSACEVDSDEPPGDDDDDDDVPAAGICRIQVIRNGRLDPLFTYEWDETGERIVSYSEWDDVSGAVRDTYTYEGEWVTDTYFRVFEVYHFIGDANEYAYVTVFEYDEAMNPDGDVTSGKRYVRDDEAADGRTLIGTSYYGYDGEDESGRLRLFNLYYELADEVRYTENTFTFYEYDDRDRLVGFTRYDQDALAGQVLARETYVPGPHYQPNVRPPDSAALAASNRFAPERVTAYYRGFTEQTYEYTYQTNRYGYVIQQDVALMDGTSAVLRLYEYECDGE